MKPRLAVVLLLLVAIPLGLLAWFGHEMTERERQRSRDQLEQVLRERLTESHQHLQEAVAATERELESAIAVAPTAFPELSRSHRLVRQVFSSRDRQIFYPSPIEKLRSSAENAFLSRIGSLEEIVSMLGRGGESNQKRSSGWHTWYHGSGRQFLYWRALSNSMIVGCEVERMAFLSDLVASLPDSVGGKSRLVLHDEAAYPIYQWGAYTPPQGSMPIAEMPAPAPLDSWRLAYFVPEDFQLRNQSSGTTLTFTAALLAIGSLLLALGSYAFWSYRREWREAEQRVSFVNQVSHELKTPLTNIRMYAELAETKLAPDDQATQECLNVVVAESGRLSRLIQNVLTFAKRDRGGLTLNPQSCAPDEVIRDVLEHFGPALTEAHFEVETDLQGSQAFPLDRDVAEQILSNLVSNALKYASEGRFLRITSRSNDQGVRILVEDRGPGVPARARRRVFAPFFRLSDRTNEGVAGTGIGLTIARDLAQQHGGDLSLISAPEGAAFEITLNPIQS